jgi:hypothetical protein
MTYKSREIIKKFRQTRNHQTTKTLHPHIIYSSPSVQSCVRYPICIILEWLTQERSSARIKARYFCSFFVCFSGLG